MVGLDKFKISKEKEDNFSGFFTIGPLSKGYGVTLGNTVRRILLSSIPGAAVTAVRIDGVKHEYSTLEGLQEDVITLILKLKELSVRMFTEEKRVLKLHVKGKKNAVCKISAADFELPSDVEIINSDLEIASLTSDLDLHLDITVEAGVGYAYPNEELREELGQIPVDAIYSPVKRVQVEVTKTRVGRDTDLDQIDLQIITNGTIKPSESLLKAAEIFDSLANRMVDLLGGDSSILKDLPSAAAEEEEKEEKKVLIGELNLSTRLNNALLNAGITNLNDLSKYKSDEVANFRGMGKKSLSELQEVMSTHNIQFNS
jgi:DNA-directed RNA polymerase subunit alpha